MTYSLPQKLLAFFLMDMILNTAVAGRGGDLAPVAIGFTLVLTIIMGGMLTGAAFKPARALGPMVATGDFSNFFLYMLAPLVGGVIAALLYKGVFSPRR
jgi:glycerol uptake facilitator-like aquaporin